MTIAAAVLGAILLVVVLVLWRIHKLKQIKDSSGFSAWDRISEDIDRGELPTFVIEGRRVKPYSFAEFHRVYKKQGSAGLDPARIEATRMMERQRVEEVGGGR